MENEKLRLKIRKALLKRALGYDTSEVVEEYSANDGDMTVIRKKVTTKNVPPDITAAKLLLDGMKSGTDDLSALTDEQLAAEKDRLLKLLKEKTQNENSKK